MCLPRATSGVPSTVAYPRRTAGARDHAPAPTPKDQRDRARVRRVPGHDPSPSRAPWTPGARERSRGGSGSRARPCFAGAVGAVAAGLPVMPVRRGDGAAGAARARTGLGRGRTSRRVRSRRCARGRPCRGAARCRPAGTDRRTTEVTTSPAARFTPASMHPPRSGDPRSRIRPSTTMPTTGSRSSTRGDQDGPA